MVAKVREKVAVVAVVVAEKGEGLGGERSTDFK